MVAGVLSLCRKNGLRVVGSRLGGGRSDSVDRRLAITISTICDSRKGPDVLFQTVILREGRAFSASPARRPRMVTHLPTIYDSVGIAQVTVAAKEKAINYGSSG